MEHDDAVQAYLALSHMFRDLEKNLAEGEAIGVSGTGANAKEFFVQTIQRVRGLVMIVGDTDDGDLEELIFSPSQISIRIFTAKRGRPGKPIGFRQD